MNVCPTEVHWTSHEAPKLKALVEHKPIINSHDAATIVH
jgi:hypothetical protein